MPTTQTSLVDPASPSLLSIEQLADWLGVTDRFIRRLVAERRIPFLKIGKFIRFDPAEIEPWLDSQRVAERSHGLTAGLGPTQGPSATRAFLHSRALAASTVNKLTQANGIRHDNVMRIGRLRGQAPPGRSKIDCLEEPASRAGCGTPLRSVSSPPPPAVP